MIFRRAVRRDEIAVDPTENLELPAVRHSVRRVESSERAEKLLDALPSGERAPWATMLYAGLRRGEVRALRCLDLDLERNLLHVERGWDDKEGPQDPKTYSGRRIVPLVGLLRRELVAHRLRTGRSGEDLLFGRTAELPFVPTTLRSRARRAWREAGLEALTPHEMRHCAASYFYECGMTDKQLASYIGHSNVRTTQTTYVHLFENDAEQATALLDAYLDRQGRAG